MPRNCFLLSLRGISRDKMQRVTTTVSLVFGAHLHLLTGLLWG